jgi:hypothetical protein
MISDLQLPPAALPCCGTSSAGFSDGRGRRETACSSNCKLRPLQPAGRGRLALFEMCYCETRADAVLTPDQRIGESRNMLLLRGTTITLSQSLITGCERDRLPSARRADWATPEALPIALQLVGPPPAEPRLLAVAYSLEQALGSLPAQWGIEPLGSEIRLARLLDRARETDRPAVHGIGSRCDGDHRW